MRRTFFQTVWMPIYRWWGLRHVQKTRTFRCAGIEVEIPPGVFHPGVYFSTPIFIEFLQSVDFQKIRTLDIGTGSGLLALFAAKKGAFSTAIDINPLAVETAQKNAARNNLPVACIQSDLFEKIPGVSIFDIVLINPPYYPKSPKNATEHAFFAGENLEYFERLFAGLPGISSPETKVWMILSEDCDLEKIGETAQRHGQRLDVVFEKRKWGERLMVLQARVLRWP